MKAIDAGVSFLLRNQDDDGAWRDFLLRPGRSESWTTAYIALRLHRARYVLPHANIDAALERAKRFLIAERTREGWSYNGNCAADADTTAHAILFLQTTGCARPADYAALAKFQLPCGGFATYRMSDPQHGWRQHHPDVTAVALRALQCLLHPDHDILRRGAASLENHLGGPHASKSYWWTSRLYLSVQLAQTTRVPPAITDTGDNFDRALALELAVKRSASPDRIASLKNALLAHHAEDGSWPSSPILRIANPRARGFADPRLGSSPLAADDRRLFTTATALNALAVSVSANTPVIS